VSPDHSYIHNALAGTDYRVTTQRAIEVLGLRASPTRIHQLCYGNFEPPRRPHGGEIPPVDFVAPCFRPPFGEGSSRTVGDLTRPARILDFVLRKTLLPRTGYRDGFTRIQQWLVAHLISQTEFDLWDLIVSEIEDTISESFRGRRQLLYTHWITLLILRARPLPLPAHLQRELTESDTVFLHYDPRQMLRAHHHLRDTPPPCAPHGPVPPPSPRGTRSTAAVLETEEQQDIAIGAFADAEGEGEFDFASDSSDDDYQSSVSDLPPRAHDHEAGGSSSASDPVLLAILEGMRADQHRAAEEQERRDRDQAAINATVQARQDEHQRQFLTFQEQQLAFQAQQTAMMAAIMAASGIQIPQIQLPGTSTVRPPTPAPQTQSQSEQPLQLSAQSQLFSTPQHEVS